MKMKTPTGELRFIRRIEGQEVKLILQQEWYIAGRNKWIDVPIEEIEDKKHDVGP